MPFQLSLHALFDTGQFVATPLQPDSPFRSAALVYGDTVPVRLFGWRQLLPGAALTAMDLSPYYVELTLGQSFERPTTGFWNIDFGDGVSSPIPTSYEAAQVQTLLGTMFVTVTGSPGDYLLTAVGTGEKEVPVVTFSGDLSVTVKVTTIFAGDLVTPAQWRVELLEAAPAKISFDEWTTGSTVAECTAENLGGGVHRVTIDKLAFSGFFRLTLGGTQTTQVIPVGASPADVMAALRVQPLGENAVVKPDIKGTYLIVLASSATTLSVDGSLLEVPSSLIGTLDLTTPGVRELLVNGNPVRVNLGVQVYDAWTMALVTFAQTPTFVVMPTQPRGDFSGVQNTAQLAFVDLPDMTTGLWHRVTLEGTNAAPVFEIGAGEPYEAQRGPVFIADDNDISVYMLTIQAGETLGITAVKAQGYALNASFQPRPFALASPEDPALFCRVIAVPPASPDFAEPATLEIGTPA